ncbi:MAG: DUF4957 domain-containing protein, partial [Duncaniella sp.]|nr:DUF4957 domain-containing protein [Duncaniella sp.]
WVDCGKDIIRRMAGGRFGGNAPLTFAYNTYFENGENLAESEAGYDKSGTILTTNPDFADAAAGDFTIGASTQQAEFQTGAPKWLVEFNGTLSTVDITVEVAADEEIVAKINAAVAAAEKAGSLVGSTTVVLAEKANYALASSIVTNGSLIINGNGATIDCTGATEEAASLRSPFIMIGNSPVGTKLGESAYTIIEKIAVDNLNVKNLATSIFYDNNKQICVADMTFDTVEFALTTDTVVNEALISYKGGGAKDFTIKNSTISGNGAVAKYFIRYNNAARLDRYGYDKETELMVNTYNNNTFYNLLKEDGQWGNYSAIAGQNYVSFDVQKNIWVDCGKDIIRRMAGGRFG